MLRITPEPSVLARSVRCLTGPDGGTQTVVGPTIRGLPAILTVFVLMVGGGLLAVLVLLRPRPDRTDGR